MSGSLPRAEEPLGDTAPDAAAMALALGSQPLGPSLLEPSLALQPEEDLSLLESNHPKGSPTLSEQYPTMPSPIKHSPLLCSRLCGSAGSRGSPGGKARLPRSSSLPLSPLQPRAAGSAGGSKGSPGSSVKCGKLPQVGEPARADSGAAHATAAAGGAAHPAGETDRSPQPAEPLGMLPPAEPAAALGQEAELQGAPAAPAIEPAVLQGSPNRLMQRALLQVLPATQLAPPSMQPTQAVWPETQVMQPFATQLAFPVATQLDLPLPEQAADEAPAEGEGGGEDGARPAVAEQLHQEEEEEEEAEAVERAQQLDEQPAGPGVVPGVIAGLSEVQPAIPEQQQQPHAQLAAAVGVAAQGPRPPSSEVAVVVQCTAAVVSQLQHELRLRCLGSAALQGSEDSGTLPAYVQAACCCLHCGGMVHLLLVPVAATQAAPVTADTPAALAHAEMIDEHLHQTVERMTQMQPSLQLSLHGQDASDMAAILRLTELFKMGDPEGALKNVICVEGVQDIAKVLLEEEHHQLPGPEVDKWVRTLWRELRAHGFERTINYSRSTSEAAAAAEPTSQQGGEEEGAEAERYLCTHEEVAARQRGFEHEGGVRVERRLRRPRRSQALLGSASAAGAEASDAVEAAGAAASAGGSGEGEQRGMLPPTAAAAGDIVVPSSSPQEGPDAPPAAAAAAVPSQAAALDIRPTLSPERQPRLGDSRVAAQEAGDGPSQLELPSSLGSLQPAAHGALLGAAGPSQLQIHPTLADEAAALPPKQYRRHHQEEEARAAGAASPAAHRSRASVAALERQPIAPAARLAQQQQHDPVDPFDMVVAEGTQESSPLDSSEPPRLAAGVAAAAPPGLNTWLLGGWGKGTQAVGNQPAAQEQRVEPTPAASPGAVSPAAVDETPSDLRAPPEAAVASGTQQQAQRQQQQQGVDCSMVPETPPEPPSPDLGTAAAGPSPSQAASADQPAPRHLPQLPATAAAGSSSSEEEEEEEEEAAGPAPLPEPLLSQDVVGAAALGGSQAVQQAMRTVAMLSSHFAATQEPVGRPLAAAAVAVAGVAAEPVAEAPELALSPRRRRWQARQAQQQVEESDDEEELQEGAAARRQPSRRAQLGAGKQQSKPAAWGVKHSGGASSKKQSRRERRRSLLAGVMAPVGARPDLGVQPRQRLLVVPAPAAKSPAGAKAAAAAAAVTAGTKSPAAAAKAMQSPASAPRYGSRAAAAAGGSGQGPSGLMDDPTCFADSPSPAGEGGAAREATSPARRRRPAATPRAAALPALAAPPPQQPPPPQLHIGAPALGVTGSVAVGSDPFRFPSSGQQNVPSNLEAAAAAAMVGAVTSPRTHKRRRLSSPLKQPHVQRQHRTSDLLELAHTAPAAPLPAVPAAAGQRQRRQRRAQPAQEQEPEIDVGVEDEGEDGEGSLVVRLLPHPIVQTAPDAAGFLGDADGMAVAVAVAAAPPAGATRPQRQLRAPSRLRTGTVAAPAAAAAAPAVVAQDPRGAPAEGVQRELQQLGVRKREAAASPARPQPAKRQRGSLTPRQAAPPALPDSEDQTIAQYLRTHTKLGCAKCRHSKGGCSKCRPGGSVTPVPEQGGAAGGAGGSNTRRAAAAASPAPAGHCTALVAASPAAAPISRRQQQQQQQREEQDGEEQDGEEVPSQDMAGQQQAAARSRRQGAAEPAPAASPAAGPAHRRSTGGAGRPLFEGCCLLITGFNDAPEEKRLLLQALREHGVTLAADVPKPPAPLTASTRRQSGARLQEPPISAVISDRRLRTPKYLYAVIKGLPVVKPEWVHACVAAKKQVPMRSQHLLCEPAADIAAAQPLVFAGLRVHLHGGRQYTAPFGQLLKHTGATLVSSIEAEPPAGRSGGTPAVVEAACDLLLLDDDAPDDPVSNRAVADARRLARRLRVPVHDRNWAIQVILSGQLPDAPAPKQPAAAATPTLRGPPAAPARPSGMAAGGRHAEQAASNASWEQPGAGAASPAGRKRTRASAAQQGQLQLQGRQPEEQPTPAAPALRTPHLSPLLLTLPGVQWVGEPQAPPQGLPATPFRTYYPGCELSGGARMMVGGCLELQPAPGEEQTRIGQLLAAWSEVAAGGQQRACGRVRRFYRPEETIFSGQSHELFRSEHIEERVLLAAAVGSAQVTLLQPGQQPAAGAQGGYVCAFQYDHQLMSLGALPPEAFA